MWGQRHQEGSKSVKCEFQGPNLFGSFKIHILVGISGLHLNILVFLLVQDALDFLFNDLMVQNNHWYNIRGPKWSKSETKCEFIWI